MVSSPARAERAEVQYLSITQLNVMLNASLEHEFPAILFEGEISTISRPASGHLYLTLKDAQSQLSAVIWRSQAQKIDFPLEPGVSVQCRGKPNVYHATGKLQLIVDRIALAGEGLLQKKFLELQAKLEKEGLFAVERKRMLPFLPKAVGVVTSDTGAVIKDIMVKIRERMPEMQVYLAPCRVQGEGAANEIAAGIKLLNQSGLVDVIIVARGGGSLQDLWAFNEEVTVRAIFGSRLPVVSGVGHEVDTTLSDLVADVRAPTPTAAAEMVVPKKQDLLARLSELEDRVKNYDRWLLPLAQRVDELALRLESRIASLYEGAELKLKALSARLSAIEPGKLLALMREKLVKYSEKLFRIGAGRIAQYYDSLFRLEKRLQRMSPTNTLALQNGKVATLEQRLHAGMKQTLLARSRSLGILEGKLESISPKRVLERGFAFVAHQGKIVRDAAELKSGDELSVTFQRGVALTEVKKISLG